MHFSVADFVILIMKKRQKSSKSNIETQTFEIDDNRLEDAIGLELRRLRKKFDMTLQDLAQLTGLSIAMVSKIENGQAAPSLSTLKAFSRAFDVPISVFFKGFEEKRDASFVQSGTGVKVSRKGRHVGHEFWLLGHTANNRVSVEPYLVRLMSSSEIFPRYQNSGVWFLHMLEGKMVFRYGDILYELSKGDSLMHDADGPHGPEELIEAPVTFILVHSDQRRN